MNMGMTKEEIDMQKLAEQVKATETVVTPAVVEDTTKETPNV